MSAAAASDRGSDRQASTSPVTAKRAVVADQVGALGRQPRPAEAEDLGPWRLGAQEHATSAAA